MLCIYRGMHLRKLNLLKHSVENELRKQKKNNSKNAIWRERKRVYLPKHSVVNEGKKTASAVKVTKQLKIKYIQCIIIGIS